MVVVMGVGVVTAATLGLVVVLVVLSKELGLVERASGKGLVVDRVSTSSDDECCVKNF